MLDEYRNRSGRPRPSRGGDPISQAGIPSEPAAERPVAGEPVDIRESIASQPIARDFTASQPMAREPVFVRTPAAEPGFIPLVQQNIRPVNVMGDSENALAAMIREQTAAMNRQTEVMEGIFASLQNISSQMVCLYFSYLLAPSISSLHLTSPESIHPLPILDTSLVISRPLD